MPRTPRSVPYAVYAEIVHGRWVRLDVTAPSPNGARDQARKLKFSGRLFVVKVDAAYEYEKEES